MESELVIARRSRGSERRRARRAVIHSDDECEGGAGSREDLAGGEGGAHENTAPQATGEDDTERPTGEGSGFVLYYLNEGTGEGSEGLEGEGTDPERSPAGAARGFHAFPP